MKKTKKAKTNGYLPEAIGSTKQPNWHYLAGFSNKSGFVVFRCAAKSFLIFQQDENNNIVAEIEIPTKELKDLAIWILRGLK